jgi:hypothetical protein
MIDDHRVFLCVVCAVQMDDPGDEKEGGLDASAANTTSSGPLSLTATGSLASGAGGGSGGEREPTLAYWEFLEAIAALACFAFKNPYLPLESKIDEFISTILQVLTCVCCYGLTLPFGSHPLCSSFGRRNAWRSRRSATHTTCSTNRRTNFNSDSFDISIDLSFHTKSYAFFTASLLGRSRRVGLSQHHQRRVAHGLVERCGH